MDVCVEVCMCMWDFYHFICYAPLLERVYVLLLVRPFTYGQPSHMVHLDTSDCS